MNILRWLIAELQVLWLILRNNFTALQHRAELTIQRTLTLGLLIAGIDLVSMLLTMLFKTGWPLALGAALVGLFMIVLYLRMALISALIVAAGSAVHWLFARIPAQPTREQARDFVRKFVNAFAWIMIANLYALVFEVWNNPLLFLTMVVLWFAMPLSVIGWQLQVGIFRKLAIWFMGGVLALGTLAFFADKPVVRHGFSRAVSQFENWQKKRARKTRQSARSLPQVNQAKSPTVNTAATVETKIIRETPRCNASCEEARRDAREWLEQVDAEYPDIE